MSTGGFWDDAKSPMCEVPLKSALRQVRVGGQIVVAENPFFDSYLSHSSEMPTIDPSGLSSCWPTIRELNHAKGVPYYQ